MGSPLFDGEGPAVGGDGGDLEGGVEAEQLAAFFARAEGEFQEPRIAKLMARNSFCVFRTCFRGAAGDGGHGRLLRAFPGGPGFALDCVEAGDFEIAEGVEVADRRFPPGGVDVGEVFADGGLAHLQFEGDLGLPLPLQIEPSDLLATLSDGEFTGGGNRHTAPFLNVGIARSRLAVGRGWENARVEADEIAAAKRAAMKKASAGKWFEARALEATSRGATDPKRYSEWISFVHILLTITRRPAILHLSDLRSFFEGPFMFDLRQTLLDAVEADERTKYRVALDAGISPIVLSRFISDKRDVKFETLTKLIDALGPHLLWVRHLIDLADLDPWFSFNLAWQSVKGSLEVAFVRVHRSVRQKEPKLRNPNDMLKFLLEHKRLSTEESEEITSMEFEAEKAEKSRYSLTKDEATRYVARAALLVEELWGDRFL